MNKFNRVNLSFLESDCKKLCEWEKGLAQYWGIKQKLNDSSFYPEQKYIDPYILFEKIEEHT